MFETGLGRELRHLLSVVSPLNGANEWSLIEAYFSAVRDVPLTWLDGNSGSADIKLYIKQQCIDRRIENVRDFIVATEPLLLQNSDAFSMPVALSYPQQASLLMSIIKMNRHDTGFAKMLLNSNDNVISAVRQMCETDGGDIKVSGSEIKKLFHSMFAVSVDTGDRQVSDMRSMLRILQHLSALDNILNLSHIAQWSLCNDIYKKADEEELSSSLLGDVYKKGFTSILSEEEQEDVYEGIIETVLQASPLEVACKLALGKKTFYIDEHGEKILTINVEQSNNLLLELGFVFKFFSNIVKADKFAGFTLVFFPSPFFIRKWVSDSSLERFPVIFIVDNPDYKDLLVRHYSNMDYGEVPRKEISFLALKEWIQENENSDNIYANVLFLPSKFNAAVDSEAILKILKRNCIETSRLYAFTTDRGFQNESSMLCSIYFGDSYKMEDLLLLPKGRVADSTSSIKCFVSASPMNAEDSSNSDISLMRSIRVESKSPDILILTPGSVRNLSLKEYFEQTDYSKLTLRNYIKDSETQNREIKTRERAEFIYFSRELKIWFTVNQSRRNPSKVRLTVSFKSFPEAGVSPKKLVNTKKTTKELLKDDIKSYVCDEYPFEPIEKKDGTILDIREIVIEEYRDKLVGKSVSLKTALYLHPEWEESFNERIRGRLWRLCKEEIIAMTPMDELSPEDYVDAIAITFPDRSEGYYSELIVALSSVIVKAIKCGIAKKNPIDEFARKANRNERAFLVLRSNLTKKTFTGKEFSDLYSVLNKNIALSDVKERGVYIGCLIRLLTGLEANLVCALQWGDFALIEDYGIYSFQIYKQVSNNGKELSILSDDFDFRSFPCPPILARTMLAWKNEFLSRYSAEVCDSLYILSSPGKGNSPYNPYQPVLLEKKLQGLVKDLGLPENVVSVPKTDGQMRETDLNLFQGDIFRENFRFWAMKKAGLSSDETAFLLGNKPDQTLFIHYVDLLNEAAQYMLYVKIRRLEIFLEYGDRTQAVVEHEIRDDSVHLIGPVKSEILQMEVHVEPDENGECFVEVESVDMLQDLQNEEKPHILGFTIERSYE